MSNFKSKYEENLKSGDLLVQKDYCNVSIHCYYYACVQVMLHILYYDMKESKEQTEQEQKKTKGGFHNWIINKFSSLLMGKDYQTAREFNNWIVALKKVRINSDYKDTIITKEKAGEAKAISFKIIETLKNNFSI